MSSLKELCEDDAFPSGQKEWFNEEVRVRLSEECPKKDIAISCLIKLWAYYDSAGISMGRSLRSSLLEKVLQCLKDDCMDDARLGLSVLIAMHYDIEYINESEWLNYTLEERWELPLTYRMLVSAAGFALEIDDIPEMSDWERDKIVAFITKQ